MSHNNGKFPIGVPFGGGGNRELITATKNKGRGWQNLIAKSRLTNEDIADITIIIGTATKKDGSVDDRTIQALETFLASTFAHEGDARFEQIMINTGLVVPGWKDKKDRTNRHKAPSDWSKNGETEQEKVLEH